ncbi:Myeloid leukemia factor [Cinara cedri]|uniref:Myeloid leukemia factor n=1 Tax=Cinara cedri TaxID=506608 RepID=A0A5E4N508_9HEMI|nr:Myeloid leukemia factor [Cinara cedri]
MFPFGFQGDLLGHDADQLIGSPDSPRRHFVPPLEQMMSSFLGGFPDPMANMMMPFGGGNIFGNYGSMINNSMNQQNHITSSMLTRGLNQPAQSFSSSTFMSYSSNGPNGQPQVYKASSSTRTGPGGIKETKKSVSDSVTGVKKLAIGHHIGDRAHIVERQKNVYSGDQEENQEYINLEDDEAEEFNNEWRNKAQNLNSHRNRYLPYTHKVQSSPISNKKHLKALPSSTSHNREALAIEGAQPEQGRKRATKQRTPKKIQQNPVNDA